MDVFRVRMTFEIDAAAVDAKARNEACFVVLHTGQAPLSAREILQNYKGQAHVEKRFPFLKDPAWVEAFFVKDPKRLEALGYVLLMALMLWTVWERRVRRNLAASGGAPLVEGTGVKHPRPTAMACLHVMEGVRLVRVIQGEQAGPWCLPQPLDAEQKRLMALSKAIALPTRALPGQGPHAALTA